VVARPEAPRFKPTQIGRSRPDGDIRLTNVSAEPVDFWDFIQTVLEPDGTPRPEGDFTIAGGATTGDGLAPGESTDIKVMFAPKASHADDLERRKVTMRGTRVSILDTDGAVAGSFTVHGKAKAPSEETLDRLETDEITSTVRHASTRPRPPKPKSFAQMRLHLMSARDLMETSERDAAYDLVADVLERMEETARYDQVLQTFRSYGVSGQAAQRVMAHAHDEVQAASRRLAGDLTVNLDYALTSFEVAKEPMQVMLGERADAPTIRAMHDASPAILAARGAEELAATAKRVVTDAEFAAGFGIGVLDGAGVAVKDLVVGVADALAMAFDIARTMVTSGLIGTAIETARKVDDFFDKAPMMLSAMGDEFKAGWSNPSSYSCGNFRGEVIGYIAAQIAIIIISGGAAAEGVAFASLRRWGKVVKVIQTLDGAGDIVGWAGTVGRRLPVPRKILDKIRDATRGGDVAADVPAGTPGADLPPGPGTTRAWTGASDEIPRDADRNPAEEAIERADSAHRARDRADAATASRRKTTAELAKRVSRLSANPFLDPEVWAYTAKLAYEYAKEGALSFEAFVKKLRAEHAFASIDFDSLSPEDLDQIGRALADGTRRAHATSTNKVEDKLKRLEEKVRSREKPKRAELDEVPDLADEAFLAQEGRRPTKRERDKWMLDKGYAERLNDIERGKARLQEVENVGGGAEHTSNARGSTADAHHQGRTRKSGQEERAIERRLKELGEENQ
jgi:hypothetical protein